jgi:uncharacterized protein
MTTRITPGRAASWLERFASGLCLTLLASAVLFAAEAQAQEPAPAPAPAPAPRAAGDGPALWAIRDADSTIYLFGALHMLRPGTAWGSDKVDAAFNSASEVWFEVVNPDDQAALAPIMGQYGLSPDKPLSSLLTADELARLDAAARSVGASAAQMDPMRPWLAALMVGSAPLTRAGFDPAQGVDLNLRGRALAAGKTVRGFETVDQQIGGLARMSEAGQLAYLRHYLSSDSMAAPAMERAVAGWIAADLDVVADFARQNGKAISMEAHQIFLAGRNADWADQIQTLLQGSGTAFVAVGTAHLVGDDSLPALLEARGIPVVRE